MREGKSNLAPRVVIDARPLQGPSSKRGIGRYVRGLLGGLAAVAPERTFALLVDGGLAMPEVPAGPFVIFAVRRRYRGRLAAYEDQVRLPGDLARIGPDLYHATSLSLPGPTPVPVVATLHDLIPWALGGGGYLGERMRYWPGRRGLARATRVLAVSGSAAADAVRLARVQSSRLDVVAEGVEPLFAPCPDARDRVARRFGLTGPYLLFSGALDRRKDPKGLVRAFEIARATTPGLQLVLAGEPGPQAPRSLGGARRLGYVSDLELVELMSAALAFVFTSRYEGFGLPVLEAMACGCPVLAYSNSALPALVADAGVLVPDGDWAELGRRAAELGRDPQRARALSRAGRRRALEFSWPRAARETLDVYARALRSNPPGNRVFLA